MNNSIEQCCDLLSNCSLRILKTTSIFSSCPVICCDLLSNCSLRILKTTTLLFEDYADGCDLLSNCSLRILKTTFQPKLVPPRWL